MEFYKILWLSFVIAGHIWLVLDTPKLQPIQYRPPEGMAVLRVDGKIVKYIDLR